MLPRQAGPGKRVAANCGPHATSFFNNASKNEQMATRKGHRRVTHLAMMSFAA
jgi:hypothetical protein